LKSCRKCGAPNPDGNQYCHKCGCVLDVATSMVRAQPKTLLPFVQTFRWRWVALSALAIMGTTALAAAGLGAGAAGLLDRGIADGSLGSIATRAPGMAAVAGAVALLAFALGGLASARMSRGRTIAEAGAGALIAVALWTAVGSSLSTDALLVGALLALPCAIAAAFGGWLGELGGRREVEP
jgi:hypothetical protein